MNYTRRQLYAAGETFGECCTRREPGRIVCGGGDSQTTQATINTDRRNAVQNGIGVTGDGNVLSVNVTDGGATRKALEANATVTARALDSVDTSNALLNNGYARLIDASTEVFDRGQSMIGQTQQMVGDAWRSANTDGKGTIDNKTIIALVVAAGATAAAIAYARRGKA